MYTGHIVQGSGRGIFSVGRNAQLQVGGGSHLWNELYRNFKTNARFRHVRREINKDEVSAWNELYFCLESKVFQQIVNKLGDRIHS